MEAWELEFLMHKVCQKFKAIGQFFVSIFRKKVLMVFCSNETMQFQDQNRKDKADILVLTTIYAEFGITVV